MTLDKRAGCISLLLLALPAWAQRTGTASIAGTVRTAAGSAVKANLTLHDLSTPRVAGQTAFDQRFGTRSDGTFTIKGVPAGRYEICVSAPRDAVLDPCLWAGPAPTVTLKDGAAVSGLAITVQTGTMLQVRVNDAQSLATQAKAGAAGADLSLVVITEKGEYHNMRVLSSDAAGHDHYLIVPVGEHLTLAVDSATVALTDAKGKPLSGDAKNISVTAGAGNAGPIVVNVGKK